MEMRIYFPYRLRSLADAQAGNRKHDERLNIPWRYDIVHFRDVSNEFVLHICKNYLCFRFAIVFVLPPMHKTPTARDDFKPFGYKFQTAAVPNAKRRETREVEKSRNPSYRIRVGNEYRENSVFDSDSSGTGTVGARK